VENYLGQKAIVEELALFFGQCIGSDVRRSRTEVIVDLARKVNVSPANIKRLLKFPIVDQSRYMCMSASCVWICLVYLFFVVVGFFL